jgi:serine/threonine protein phosphatase PrpC
MSRSIGDRIGKQIGVIAEPIVTQHVLDDQNEFFLAAASDGVWDVMENLAVVDFIENWRAKSLVNTEVTKYSERTT